MERLEPNALHFYMFRTIFKRKKREMKPTQFSHLWKNPWSLCLDKKKNPNSLLGERQRTDGQ